MKGKCLCGAIEFTAEEKPGQVVNCHCSVCRISHGAAFASIAFADRGSLQFEKGEEMLSEYTSAIGVHIACLDSSYTGKLQAHCFTGSKAPWHEPSPDIPSFEEYPSL